MAVAERDGTRRQNFSTEGPGTGPERTGKEPVDRPADARLPIDGVRVGGSAGRGERLIDIGNDVVDMFDADRQPHHVLADPGRGQFLGTQLTVGRRCRVTGQ